MNILFIDGCVHSHACSRKYFMDSGNDADILLWSITRLRQVTMKRDDNDDVMLVVHINSGLQLTSAAYDIEI